MYGMIGGDVKLEFGYSFVWIQDGKWSLQIFYIKYLSNKRKFLGLSRENTC